MVKLSHPYMPIGKTIALTRQTFVGKVMSLLFNMLSKLVRASLIAQLVKNPPAMRETWVQSMSWEDPLEKGKAPTLVSWPGESHGLYSPWVTKSRTRLGNLHFHFHWVGHSFPSKE